MHNKSLRPMNETEEAALARRLVERSGLSVYEADDMVDAYLNAESDMVGAGEDGMQQAER